MKVLQRFAAIFTFLVLIRQLKKTKAQDRMHGSPLVFANQHPNIYIFETDQLILPCPIDAPSSTVGYTWFRGNQELPASMVNREGSLVIPNVTEGEYASREGVDYYCIASDNIGYSVAIRSRTITVYYAYFNGFERMAGSGGNTIDVSIPVALNSDVALECDVLDAKPPPLIKWYNDLGPIQEVMQGNNVRFLDGGRYLYLRRLQPSHLQRYYYCTVTNANLHQVQEISAPTRYVLTDNLAQGLLMDYKQIGNLSAFVGNTSIEFAYVGGVFGSNINGTVNTLTVDGGEVTALGNIGMIDLISSRGMIKLEASVSYNGLVAVRMGTLTIYQVPRITSNLQDEREHFTIEDNLMYTCEFEGFPFPSITFYFNGRLISTETFVSIINNTLTISFPQVSHSGIYQCIVSNEFGDDQRAWLLEIREPTLPQVQPFNFTKLDAFNDRDLGALIVRDNGSHVTFSLDVVADPCPDVAWSFNGTRLGPSNDTFTYNNACAEAGTSSPNWTFTLRVLLTAATSGSYIANFTNIAGSTQSSEAYFTIPESVSIINLSLNETCLKEGSTVSLRCNIRGFPRPRIVEFWQDGIEIIPGAELHNNVFMEFYDEIVIMNITMNAGGHYSCIATSVSDLQLQVAQQFDFCTTPFIISTDFTLNPQIGEPFFIECTVDGIPMPSVSWTKDRFPLKGAGDDSIRIVTIAARKSSRVEVSEASTSYNGVYECIAINDAGSVSTAFLIELLQEVTVHPDNLRRDNGTVSFSLGAIIGIAGGVTLITVLAVLFVIILAVWIHPCSKKSSTVTSVTSWAATNYSTNLAYMRRPVNIDDGSRNNSGLQVTSYPLYDTIPDLQQSDEHGEAQNEKNYERAKTYESSQSYERVQTYEKPQLYETAQTCERVQAYERITHCDVQFDIKHNEPQRDKISKTIVN